MNHVLHANGLARATRDEILNDPDIERLVKRAARRAARRPEFRSEDIDDLAQGLWVFVLRAWDSFDPTHGDFPALASTAVTNGVETLSRRERALKRVPPRGLVQFESAAGTPIEPAHDSAEPERIETQHDVRALIEDLPLEHRHVAGRLMNGDSACAIARGLDLSRHRVRSMVAEIKRRVEAQNE